MGKLFIILGSISGFLGVALGAFGAHALKNKISADMLSVYQTAVQYHLTHAIALVLIGFIAHSFKLSGLINWSGWLMFSGIILFSGSLYILSITGISKLGAITPIGGLAFLAGWVLLAMASWKYL